MKNVIASTEKTVNDISQNPSNIIYGFSPETVSCKSAYGINQKFSYTITSFTCKMSLEHNGVDLIFRIDDKRTPTSNWK